MWYIIFFYMYITKALKIKIEKGKHCMEILGPLSRKDFLTMTVLSDLKSKKLI